MAETRIMPSDTQANIEENLLRILALIDDLDERIDDLDERVEALEDADTSGGGDSGGDSGGVGES